MTREIPCTATLSDDGTTVTVKLPYPVNLPPEVPVVETPPPAVKAARFGVNGGSFTKGQGATAEVVAAHLRESFPGARYARGFTAPGSGLPALDSPINRVLADLQAEDPEFRPHLSWKDDATDRELDGWFTAAAKRFPRGFYATMVHEPENNWTLPDKSPDLAARDRLFSRWRRMRAVRDANAAGATAVLVGIHTLYWCEHKGSWRTFWPGSDVLDRIGFDCYTELGPDGNSKPYRPPADMFAIPLAASAEAGVPLLIPEVGSVQRPDDPEDTARAAWFTAVGDYLRPRVEAVGAWCAYGTNGKSYHLCRLPASRDSWRAEIAK